MNSPAKWWCIRCGLMFALLVANLSATPFDGKSNLEANLKKLKRDSRAKVTTIELDAQETGFLPAAYHSPAQQAQTTGADYAHDSAKDTYGKHAADWSLYDAGNHGQYDNYADKGWSDTGHDKQAKYGQHDSYGNAYNSQKSDRGSGYYSRDRGYGYEKHYSYDKEVASKQHADDHNNYGHNQGVYDNYGSHGLHAHARYGHNRGGQLSRYGNQIYANKAYTLAGHHDAAHDSLQDHYHNNHHNHHYAQPYKMPPSEYPDYTVHYKSSSSSAPTYRSTYTDYTPQVEYNIDHPSALLNYY